MTEHLYERESEIGTTFLGTSTAVDAAAFTSPAEVSMQFLPRGAEGASVRVAHEARVHAAISRGVGLPTRLTNFREVQAMEARCAEVECAHRAAIGWVTLDELYRLVPANRAMAEASHCEVELNKRGA